MVNNGYTQDKNGKTVFYKSVIAGALAGMLGVSVSSPLYLIKTHLQSKAAVEIAGGYQHDHKRMWTGLGKIYKDYGVIIRCSFVYLIFLTKNLKLLFED